MLGSRKKRRPGNIWKYFLIFINISTIVDHVRLQFVGIHEGVAHPVVHRGHLAAPHGLIHHGVLVFYVMNRVLDGGITGESLLLDTTLNT